MSILKPYKFSSLGMHFHQHCGNCSGTCRASSYLFIYEVSVAENHLKLCREVQSTNAIKFYLNRCCINQLLFLDIGCQRCKRVIEFPASIECLERNYRHVIVCRHYNNKRTSLPFKYCFIFCFSFTIADNKVELTATKMKTLNPFKTFLTLNFETGITGRMTGS